MILFIYENHIAIRSFLHLLERVLNLNNQSLTLSQTNWYQCGEVAYDMFSFVTSFVIVIYIYKAAFRQAVSRVLFVPLHRECFSSTWSWRTSWPGGHDGLYGHG